MRRLLCCVAVVTGCTSAGVPPEAQPARRMAVIVSARPIPAGRLAEFIVRTPDGQTLSVVQPADPDLRPGQTVELAAEPAMRIVRP